MLLSLTGDVSQSEFPYANQVLATRKESTVPGGPEGGQSTVPEDGTEARAEEPPAQPAVVTTAAERKKKTRKRNRSRRGHRSS